MAAVKAISAACIRIVVSEGQVVRAMALSPKPTTDSASGTAMPCSWAATSTPAAMASVLAKIALGRGLTHSISKPA